MSDDDAPLSLMEFPCDFPLKIMGKDMPEFHHIVRALVERHSGPVADDAIQTAVSRNGRFVSITITVSATSKEQLDAIYRDLTAHDDILMAF